MPDIQTLPFSEGTRSLEAPIGLSQKLVVAFYRNYAQLTSGVVGGGSVRSVLLHRSVAAGEVSLGFSDIDLLAILAPQPSGGEGPALLELLRRVRLLKWINPRLGHIEVHDPEGFALWLQLDTYRGSQERRSASLLRGDLIGLPPYPVSRADALRRFVLWPYYFLSAAVHGLNRRNLRKIALEMWNAYAVVIGLIPEPFLTRGATELLCRTVELDPAPGNLHKPHQALTFLFRTAAQLHARLLPPLPRLLEPIRTAIHNPFRSTDRVLVVVPTPDFPLLEQPGIRELPDTTLFVTPELLDLCIHFAMPVLYWSWTPALAPLGIRPPDAASYFSYARYHAQSHFLRTPGFINGRTDSAIALTRINAHIARHLRQGDNPPPINTDTVLSSEETVSSYYLTRFAGLFEQNRETASLLQSMRIASA
jgi:predicted nucleotidyltransferase